MKRLRGCSITLISSTIRLVAVCGRAFNLGMVLFAGETLVSIPARW